MNSYEKSMAGTAHFLQGMIEERLLQEENSGPDYDSRPVRALNVSGAT